MLDTLFTDALVSLYVLRFNILDVALLEPGRLPTALYNNGLKNDKVIKNITLINDKVTGIITYKIGAVDVMPVSNDDITVL